MHSEAQLHTTEVQKYKEERVMLLVCTHVCVTR